jgi:hypothetical protein
MCLTRDSRFEEDTLLSARKGFNLDLTNAMYAVGQFWPPIRKVSIEVDATGCSFDRIESGSESRKLIVKTDSEEILAAGDQLFPPSVRRKCKPYSAATSKSSSCVGGGESMATAIQVSASLIHLDAMGNFKFTFPIFAIGAILTTLVTFFLNVTVPKKY